MRFFIDGRWVKTVVQSIDYPVQLMLEVYEFPRADGTRDTRRAAARAAGRARALVPSRLTSGAVETRPPGRGRGRVSRGGVAARRARAPGTARPRVAPV